MKFIYSTYKTSVHTSQRAQCTPIRKTNQLMMYKGIITVYCKDRMKYNNKLCGQN